MPRPKQVRAARNQKTIEVTLRFWTNNLARKKGYVLPKHAWPSGVAFVQKNDTHGIKSANPRPFNSLLDVGAVIESLLVEHQIRLHANRRMKKYLT